MEVIANKKYMVGDRVIADGEKSVILELRRTCAQVEPSFDLVEYGDIQPNPLTEEILEKNNFQRQEEERGFSEPFIVYVNDDYRMSIKIYPKGIMDRYHHLYIGDYDDDPFISLYINYVHELQHALRLVGLDELADNLKV